MKFVFILVAFSVLLVGYESLIEPKWLEVTRYNVQANVTPPLKIAHLTDLHLKNVGSLHKKIIDILGSERPDVVVITGDTIDDLTAMVPAQQFLSRLSAPMGVYTVLGNWEHWVGLKNAPGFFEESGVQLLLNEAKDIRTDVRLIGFDDSRAGVPTRPDIRDLASSKFSICLFHSPDFFEQALGQCTLSLSGHTHGGQVRIPFWGPLWLPDGSGEFQMGWYKKNDSQLYVGRGIGTSILPVRFLCRPELTIMTIGAKEK